MSDPKPSEFAQDTTVTRDGDHWVGEVSPRWAVGSNPNGGYLLAIATRAMLADSGHSDPWTITAHYLSPPAAGPCTSQRRSPRRRSGCGRSGCRTLLMPCGSR